MKQVLGSLVVLWATAAAASDLRNEASSRDRPPLERPMAAADWEGWPTLEPAPAPALDLVWFDVHQAVPFAYQQATREVSAIFEALGGDVAWSRGGPGHVTTQEQTQVILVAVAPAGLSSRAMGAAPEQPSPHAIWVYLPNVAWALGLDFKAVEAWSEPQRRELAVAVGRVVAHELIHAVAHRPHAAIGLMKSQLGRATLVAPGVVLDASTQADVRAALTRRSARLRARPVLVTHSSR